MLPYFTLKEGFCLLKFQTYIKSAYIEKDTKFIDIVLHVHV